MHTLSWNLIYPSDLMKLNVTFPNVHTHIYVYMAISLQNTFSLCIFSMVTGDGQIKKHEY